MSQSAADLAALDTQAKELGRRLCCRATDGSDGDDREKWAVNGLRFATAMEAAKYGSNLYGRWTGCQGYHVCLAPEVPSEAAIPSESVG
jgi:hypothetical protein